MQQQQCYDEILLRRFLDEQLSDQEESQLMTHLGDCSNCQLRLDEISNGKNRLTDLAMNLANHPFEETVWHSPQPSEGPQEILVSDIKSILGPTDDPTMLGRLGNYEICGIVGRGSTGVVFKARDPRLNRFVAIKMLAPGYSVNGSSRKRFEREGRAIAAVRDDHVIPIYGVDEFQDKPFIVMQYMPAGSLQQRLDQQGPLTTREVVRIGMQIASGLAAAHRQGIIHRDVKPANVLLEDGVERAVVTDFGLARVADEATMTRSGSISGTPQFMSPEQARGETLDGRSDLFSLGSVLYAACTGHSPFRSETLFGVIKRVCEDQPRPIRETTPEIEHWLAAFIDKLQSKRREDRFDSAQQVVDLLADELAHLQSPTIVSQPARIWWTNLRPQADTRTPIALKACAALLFASLVGAAGWFGYSQFTEQVNTNPPNQSLNFANDQEAELELAIAMEQATQDLTREEQLAMLKRKAYRQFAKDDYANAEKSFRAILDLAPNDENAALHYGVAIHMQGKLEAAIPWHQRAAKSKRYSGFGNYNLACVAAIKGETDEAFDFLQMGIENGFVNIDHIESDPDLKSLRDKPRYAELLRLAKKLRYEIWESDGSNQIRLSNGTLFTGAAKDKIDEDEQKNEKECEELIKTMLSKDLDKFQALLDTIDPNCSCKDYEADRTTIALPRRSPLVTAAKLGNLDFGRLLMEANADVEFSAASEVTPLMTAAEYGHLDFVKLLLENKAKINVMLDGRGTPLSRAAGNGHLDVVKFLISKGASVDSKIDGTGTALLAAAKGGHDRTVEYLLDQDVDINEQTSGVGTAISAAARNGHVETVKLLISEGADINRPADGIGTALIAAAQHDRLETVELLISNGARVNQSVAGVGTAFTCAARNGNLSMMRKLVELGADVKVKTDGVGTSLSVAARGGDFETIEFLLAQGADLDGSVHGVGTPLIVAIKSSNFDVAKYLIAKGAGLDVKTDGVGTALIVASREHDVNFMRYLISRGADINESVDGVGTPLSVAVKRGDIEAIKLLLDKNADVNKRADGASSPLTAAVRIRNAEITKLLLENGATVRLKILGGKDALGLANDLNDKNLLELLNQFDKVK